MADLSPSTPSSPVDASPALNTVQTTLEKFLTAANVESVYGPPIMQGEHLVIPAAEVLSIVGLGAGYGAGQSSTDPESGGSGGGGGGGGRVLSRPVAAIILSPTGVRVEPIVDVTKIALAMLTTVGFMAAMFRRMSGRRPKLED